MTVFETGETELISTNIFDELGEVARADAVTSAHTACGPRRTSTAPTCGTAAPTSTASKNVTPSAGTTDHE